MRKEMRISTAAIAVKRARIRYSRLKKVFAPWRIYPPISAIRALDEGWDFTHEYSHAATPRERSDINIATI